MSNVSQEQPKCVMCNHREGTILSTANRLYCEDCVDSLGDVDYIVELEAERDRYKAALEEIASYYSPSNKLIEIAEKALVGADSHE